jgi:hypothetical protein
MYHQNTTFMGLLSVTLFACGAQEPIDTYHDVKITPESLLELGPKLDAATEKFFETWLYDHRHVVGLLSNLPVHGELDIRMKRRERIEAFLKICGFETISKFNFIIPVVCNVHGVEKKYTVRIAGAANLRENFNAELGNPENQSLALHEYKQLDLEGKTDTYQTISRLPHGLRIHEWLERHPLAPITAPKIYLMHIPTQPTRLVDKNYVIVQEWVDSIGSPEDHPEIFLKALPGLMAAARYAGIGAISTNNFQITPDHKVAFTDLEQRNNFNKNYFFLQNRDEYEKTVQEGVDGFNEIRKKLEAIIAERQAPR